MLQVNQLIGFGAARPLTGGIAVSDLGTAEHASGGSTATFSFGSFGAAASDRYLIALIAATDTFSSFNISSATIGGVSATIVVDAGGPQKTSCAILIANVPSGASGDVVVSWSESISGDQLCTLLRATGLSGTTASGTATTNSSSATSLNTSIDCPAGGVVVGTAGFRDNTSPVDWTNLAVEADESVTTDLQMAYGAAYELFASAQTALSITAAMTGSPSNRDCCMALASFAAA